MSTVDAVRTLFLELGVTYLQTNDWSQMGKGIKKSREGRLVGRTEGVEIRKLPKDHVAYGGYGLFATRSFEACDIIAEYVGVVQRENGEYVADLRGTWEEENLGVNGEFAGNEMRFINDFHGIAEQQNVTFRRVFVDTTPRIMVVCKRDINIGEELLTSYGDAYVNRFLRKEDAPAAMPAI